MDNQELSDRFRGLHTLHTPKEKCANCACAQPALCMHCAAQPETVQPVDNYDRSVTTERINSTPVSYKRLTLTEVTTPDPTTLANMRALLARFGGKPLWGTSSVGEVGTDPNLYAVPWRLWWEGLV